MDHGGQMDHMAHAGLLPPWVRAAWVAAFLVIAMVHLHHAVVMRGQRRLWHVGHILMAAAMAYMYLPHPAQVVPAMVGAVAFSVAATAAVTAVVWARLRAGMVNPLWALAAMEMTVMVYMFLPTGARNVVLSGVLAAYLTGVGALWVLGRWDQYYRRDITGRVTGALAPRRRRQALALRTSLATMTGGMAYMLLAM